MAQLVYIDETGSNGSRGAKSQPLLTLVAVIVPEDKVMPLAQELMGLARKHLGRRLPGVEFHGYEIWHGEGHWSGREPAVLLSALEDAIGLLDVLDLDVAHASIDKAKLRAKYAGTADGNAYRLALQFLVEKIDALRPRENRVLIADEAKHEETQAVKMVADLQVLGMGQVPGKQLTTVIDCLHYVDSASSAGVQLADMVAFVLQRDQRPSQGHPDADAAIGRMRDVIWAHTRTWREAWPA